jgi:predicted nucleotidyltransferase
MIPKSELTAYLQNMWNECSINTLYLFGSRAGEQFSSSSDLDLAVIFAVTNDKESSWWQRVDLQGKIADDLKLDVDLIDLADTQPYLGQEILQTGELIFCKDEGQRVETELKIRREYWDLLPYRQYYRREVLGIDS